MSHAATRWASRQRTGSPPAKAVLLILAHHADAAGRCFPSVETIAAETELCLRSARQAITSLATQGLVTVCKRRRPDGTQAASAYTLQIERRQSASPAPHQSAPPAPNQSASHGVSQSASPAPLVLPTEVLEPREREATAARARPRTATNGSAVSLNTTAHTPLAHEIIASWAATHPGVLLTVRRQLAHAVDHLMRDGADPTLVQAALDEADSNPEWRNPTKALPYAYDRVRRRAADRPPAKHRPSRPSTTDQRVADAQALKARFVNVQPLIVPGEVTA